MNPMHDTDTGAEDQRRAHITLKAVATVTDEGLFTAVISTQSIDREKDIVDADGMVKALRKWPRPIPLTWEHSTKPEDIFGHIYPQSVKNVNGEVVADGQVDLESNMGREAWRSFKSRSLGFSFAYLTLAATKRQGGGNHITELDVFEITGTRAPMNNDTRVLSTKAADGEPVDEAELPKDAGELRQEAKRVEREVEQTQIPDVPEPPTAPAEPELDIAKELQEVKGRLAQTEQALADLKKKAEVTGDERTRSVDPLRKQAETVALEIASGGESLRKPPKTVEPTRPEPSLSLKELKQRTRDEMLGVLSGGTIE